MKNKKTLIAIIIMILIIVVVSVYSQSRPEIGIAKFGTLMGETTEIAEGYPGFSLFYDKNDVESLMDNWAAWSQDLFGKGLFEGLLGEGLICRDLPSGTTGGDNNIATGADPGSAAAWILAEQVKHYITPTEPRYLYKIQFYATAGNREDSFDSDYVCEELDFQIIQKWNDKPLIKSSSTGGAWTFKLREGQAPVTQLTSLNTDLLLAISSADLSGQEICIRFTHMNREGCLQGHNSDPKEENEVCSVIVAGEEYSYDYDGLGWFTELTTLGGADTDWNFVPVPDDTGDTPVLNTVSTDPVTGTPTDTPILVLD